MTHFAVYTKHGCTFCTAAKGWMIQHGHTFTEMNVEDDAASMAKMKALVPRSRTVPQIFLGDYAIGGYTDLIEAARNGSLDMLIEAIP